MKLIKDDIAKILFFCDQTINANENDKVKKMINAPQSNDQIIDFFNNLTGSAKNGLKTDPQKSAVKMLLGRYMALHDAQYKNNPNLVNQVKSMISEQLELPEFYLKLMEKLPTDNLTQSQALAEKFLPKTEEDSPNYQMFYDNGIENLPEEAFLNQNIVDDRTKAERELNGLQAQKVKAAKDAYLSEIQGASMAEKTTTKLPLDKALFVKIADQPQLTNIAFDGKSMNDYRAAFDGINSQQNSIEAGQNNCAKKIKAYKDFKARMDDRKLNFFQKLIHPIRTYRENSLLKHMKNDIMTNYNLSENNFEQLTGNMTNGKGTAERYGFIKRSNNEVIPNEASNDEVTRKTHELTNARVNRLNKKLDITVSNTDELQGLLQDTLSNQAPGKNSPQSIKTDPSKVKNLSAE